MEALNGILISNKPLVVIKLFLLEHVSALFRKKIFGANSKVFFLRGSVYGPWVVVS